MKTTEKNDHVGYLSKVELKNTTVLNIFTKADNYRWWKVYFQDKVFVILSWKTELTTFDWEKDITTTYDSSSGNIAIPAWTPNIFYFPKDTEMIEWFPTGVKTEKYERYRDLKWLINSKKI